MGSAHVNATCLRGLPIHSLRPAFQQHGLRAERCDQQRDEMMNSFVSSALVRSSFLQQDIEYHILRASMVIVFLFFGYQKWFDYEAQVLIPYISNGPFIFWMYPAFGIRGASWFLGVSEWLIGALLFLGFWDKRIGILGAAGSTVTFITTVTIIPFMPGGWAPSAGGFPAMAGNVPFLMKDLIHEGSGASGRVDLFAETGHGAPARPRLSSMNRP
jgi:uncharacterized membrane protein YkgB